MAEEAAKVDILAKVQEFRRDGETGNQDRRKRMRRCRRFKVGKQWDKDVENYYKSKRKHALTINRILPTVLQVCGVQIQNPKDIKARNIKGGSATVANIFTSLIKHTLDSAPSNASYQQSQMFEDGLTTGMGCLYAEIDKTEDPKNGNLIIKKLNPFRVITDPNVDEYDPNISGKFIIFDEYIDQDILDAKYPDKKNDLGDTSYSTEQGIWGKLVHFFFPATEDYDTTEGEPQNSRRKYRYRLTHTFWKEWKKEVCLYRLDDDELEPMRITDPKLMTRAKKIEKENPNHAAVYETVKPLLHHTLSVGDVLLEDIENPFPNSEEENQGVMLFPIFLYYPYFEDGYAYGIVENITGPQEEHNYCRSAMLNLVKKLANTGWIGNKIPDKYKEFLQDHGGEDGIVLETSRAGGSLAKIEETKLPDAHAFIAERSAQDIQEIPNVHLAKPEKGGKKLGWQAMAIREQNSLTGSAVVFRNFDYTMITFATFLVEVIRQTGVYSEAEIRAVVDEADLIDSAMLSEAAEMLKAQGIEMPAEPQPAQTLEGMDERAMQELAFEIQGEMETFQEAKRQYDLIIRAQAEDLLFEDLKTIRTGKYGIRMDQSPKSPTLRMARFMELLELHKTLIESQQEGIPRDKLIAASDVANKEELINV